jgi:hypothetical protein
MTSLDASAPKRSANFFKSEAMRRPQPGLVHVIIHQPASEFIRLPMLAFSCKVISYQYSRSPSATV